MFRHTKRHDRTTPHIPFYRASTRRHIMLDTAKTLASEKLVYASSNATDDANARLNRVLQAAQADRTDPMLAADFLDVLFETINTIRDAGYETIPTSSGMSWLLNNPKTFEQMVVVRT